MTLFIIQAFLWIALLSFIYQGIILPTILDKLKYKLYAQRDRVRRISIELHGSINREMIEHLDESLSNNIRCLSIINVRKIFRFKELVETDEKLKRYIERINKLYIKHETKEIREIRKIQFHVVMMALTYNSLILGLNILPILYYALKNFTFNFAYMYSTFKNGIMSIVEWGGNRNANQDYLSSPIGACARA